jgi:hypothetical protein
LQQKIIETETNRMLAMPGARTFSLSPIQDRARISCGPHGVFVGDVALLKQMPRTNETGEWIARPVAELNSELTDRYRLPIDVSSKAGALALIANAFNCCDLALAAIATVQMQFPDPPSLAKEIETHDAITRRALDLYRSGLLKAYWDPAKHPRVGTPPNPGWFAPVDDSSQTPWQVAQYRPQPRPFESGGGGGVVEHLSFRFQAFRDFCRRAV